MRSVRQRSGTDAVGVLMTVITIIITGFVGFTVLSEVTKQELVEASKDLETVCNGVAGGCGYSPVGLVGPAFVIVIGAVIVVYLAGLYNQYGGTEETDTGGGSDPVAQLQEQYVDGEIQTTVKLERELTDVLEPELDEAALQELDDLLDGEDDNA